MLWPNRFGHLKIPLYGLVLILILAVALGLRLYGIGWDQGYGFHPDERSIYMRADCMYKVLTEAPGYAGGVCFKDNPGMEPGLPGPGTFIDADRSPLNPHWFPLGNLLIYLIVGIRSVVELFTDFGSFLTTSSYIGRSITALADVGTVFLAFLLGRRIYGTRAGLLAAALIALAVVHIQNSHFYRPEPLLILFLVAAFWFMLQVIERRRLRDSVLLGLFVGLAFAMKASILPIILPLALVYGFRLFTTPEGMWSPTSRAEVTTALRHALLAGGVVLAVFAITTPYAILDIWEFVGQNGWQARMARTAGTVPFTVQYIGTTPFLWELRQTSVWALGLPLGIVAWGGLLFALFNVANRLQGSISGAMARFPAPRAELLFIAWVVPNVVLLSFFEVKFLRYIFPVIPFLIIMGSGMLFWLLERARTVEPPLSMGQGIAGAGAFLARHKYHAVIGVITFVVAATAFYAISFERVYARDHPAIQASQWINENVPGNSTIVSDTHWDEGLPELYRYQVEWIPIYNNDTLSKMQSIAGQLTRGDYLVFYSNRTYGSVARVPERYPLSSRYYHLLFSGELGYRLDRAFTSYPQFLGVAFKDDTFTRAGIPEPELLKNDDPASLTLNLGYADENVMDYDHPKVLIFKNVDRLSSSHLSQLLTAGEPQLGLMLTPEDKATQREGGTWSKIVKRRSWANSVPVLAWLLLVELIYVAALPLATFLFRPLPDRGIILARLLGILGVAFVAWLVVSLGWMDFSRESVLVGILVVASLSALVLFTRWREVRDFLVKNWRLLAIGELLFLAAFLSFVVIRMANPDLWHPFRGGEKPMDFAYLNAVLRSTTMPPYDPWFAGGYLNYYYWGQFVLAALIKATGILPSVAYNLVVPFLFALTVTAAYSLVYNVTAGISRLGPGTKATPGQMGSVEPEIPSKLPTGEEAGSHRRRRWGGWWESWRIGVPWGPVMAGLVAGLFVAVMGNMDGIVQLAQGSWDSLTSDKPFPAFDFWQSSRMLPRSDSLTPSFLTFWLPGDRGTEIGPHITEFPFFSFLFADLHAHMIIIPFTLLVVGLALSLLVGIARSGQGWWLAATTTAAAIAVGSLWAINSWDYPTYLLLVAALIGLGVYLRPGDPMARLGLFLLLVGGMVALSYLAFQPFHETYRPFPTGLDVSRWRTPLHNYLAIHGVFFFLILTFLVYVARGQSRSLVASLAKRAAHAWGASAHTVGIVRAVPRPKAVPLIVGSLLVAVVVYLAAAQYWMAALLTLILGLVALAAKEVVSNRGAHSSYALFPLVLIALALLITIGVEFVRVEDDIGRMNTLFKFYLEVWVLQALASAYILWYLGTRGFFRLRGITFVRGAWLGVLAILLASSFIYPILGTRARLADRNFVFSTQNMTLDGADFMKTAVHRERGKTETIELVWDYQAIQWLQDNVEGSPVLLEAHTGQYNWGSRISDYTGLPTVLGWPWHQIQQRMEFHIAIPRRAAAVEEIYSTTDIEQALELLRSHEVEYVVVGQLEGIYYPAEGLQKFRTMERHGLAKLVYQNDGTQIYKGLW